MSNYFGFIDETGVLPKNSRQRFFALGLLKVQDTAELYQKVFILKDQVRYELKYNKEFEFKFNSITNNTVKYYKKLLDIYFNFSNPRFCCLILDKLNPNIDVDKYFKSSWEAYIGFTKLLIKNNTDPNEKICILADYFAKPRTSPMVYEREINKLPQVFNTCMLESHASLFIQLVDVLAGSIVRNFCLQRGMDKDGKVCKNNIANYLWEKLNKVYGDTSFTTHSPNYFSVWEFNPRI